MYFYVHPVHACLSPLLSFQYSSVFDDYIDYRLNRKHRGALARSILNQMDLDAPYDYEAAKVSKYPPLPNLILE